MHTVGILGGMGPAAGADFVRLFVQACAAQQLQSGAAVRDQGFPEHWLAQVPVPDRTLALVDTVQGSHQPLEPMLQTLGRLAAVGARSVAIACNTAHAWHASLQQRFPQVELLHIAQETAHHLAKQGTQAVALMATEGTYRVGLYEQAFGNAGLVCHLPTALERARITEGIFEGVKAGDMALAEACFGEVVLALHQRYGGAPIIMGCTEIPLALQHAHQVKHLQQLLLIDPAQVLAAALAQRAYAA